MVFIAIFFFFFLTEAYYFSRSISPAAHLWKNQIFFMTFVCALFVLQFFSFVLHPFSNWGPKHHYTRVKFQNGLIGEKVVSIVCASFVRAEYEIFSDCAQLDQKLWTKFRISRSRILLLCSAGEMKIQNGPI